MTDIDTQRLGQELAALARSAYAPYSGFHVAAILIGDDGEVARGVNMENASYGLSLCAETGAFAAATTDGRIADVRTVAVIGGRMTEGTLTGGDPVLPCGRCRQIIFESASLQDRDIDLLCFSGDGAQLRRTTIRTLLPDAFGPGSL